MKPEHPLNKKLATTMLRKSKPAAYCILLLLTYTLGYFSHPSATSSSSAIDPFRVTTNCADMIPPDTVRGTLIHDLFNDTSPFHNFPPAYVAGNLQRTTKVFGWGSYGAVFENVIRKVKPRVIVEVGTFLGASAIHMGKLTRKHGLETQILCIDHFRGWAGFQLENTAMVNGDILLLYQFLQNVVTFNQTESILPLPYSSGSALTKLCQLGVIADLVEIDAGHDYLSAWNDINHGYRILRPGGIIFGHDYFLNEDNRGVRRAVDLFARINGLRVKVDGEHWVIHT